LSSAVATLASVYAEVYLPHDVMPIRFEVPPSWLRIPPLQNDLDAERRGLIIYGWDNQRAEQWEHFLDCIVPSSLPTFRMLHVVLPHDPWDYLPSGRHYQDGDFTRFPLGAHGTIGELWSADPLAVDIAWQRYLLQLQFTDRLLGRLLDRLESQRLLEETLLVVVADHGMAFVPGLSRREPEPETLPDLVSVPLFIKLPGQTAGTIDDRNVEIIDILPTIADVLQLELPRPTDGQSLLDPQLPPRPRKTVRLTRGELALPPDFPERRRYLERLLQRFGPGGPGDRLMKFSLEPDWLGRPIDSFSLGPDSALRIALIEGGNYVAADASGFVPCYFHGQVVDADPDLLPVRFVVAVNGVIGGVARTLNDPQCFDQWQTLVDDALFHPGHNDVGIYEVRAGGTSPAQTELRRCRFR